MSRTRAVTFLVMSALLVSAANAQTVEFTVSVNKDSAVKISPYIFGTNQELAGGENWGAMRIGGNRLTGYNWENNASNAGSDYLQESDDYLADVFGVGDSSSVPAIVTGAFYNEAKQFDAYPLVTLQMAGFVAKDKNGPVSASEAAPSPRWAYAKFVKGSPLSITPDTSDDTVFMDEYVNFLVNKYGPSTSPTGIKGYELDNEPDLWNSTHPRLHPLQPTCQELVNKSVALSLAVKTIDPSAEIFGPVSYGFNGYLSFQSAKDWNAVSAGKPYSWFLDYYLDRMKAASDSAGRRLLDVLDLHWYSEAIGDYRITDDTANSLNDALARVQAPRSLWDPNYHENSWIEQYDPRYLPLLPKILNSINKYYPGTKLAFTEFNFGGENDISGALAMADVLGIFTKYGVYMSDFWELNSPSDYISAAYKIFRNFDGNNSTIADYYVPSYTSDVADCSVYGSVDDGGNTIHIIVINKSYTTSFTGDFVINSTAQVTGGQVWEVNRYSPNIQRLDSVTYVADNSFTYPVPSRTVLHFVLSTTGTINRIVGRTVPAKYELTAYPNPFNPSCRIDYNIPGNSVSTLQIYSVNGILVKTFDRLSHSGYVYWNGTNNSNFRVASGVYFVFLRNADRSFAMEKLLLLK